MEQVIEWLEAHRADLADQYHKALRATLFSNRSEVRPAMLRSIVGDEVEALLGFLRGSQPVTAVERGERLCRIGLSEESVLRLGQTARHFCLVHIEDSLRLSSLEAVETYHSAVVQGFVQTHKVITLEEQERIRSALQRTLSRYTIQMEVAADVARATTSILDLNLLLQTTVDLICERFELDYAGIFLVDESGRWAVLQAATGKAGREMLQRSQRLEVAGDSIVGWCITHNEARVALDVGGESARFVISQLPDIHSEMAVPLISRDKVTGAMVVQSRRVAAFSEQDVTVLRILVNQLANAIENARLFEELYEAKEAAEAASRAKSTFLANVSHELRTPLTSVLGFAKISKKRLDQIILSTLPKDNRSLLQTVERVMSNIDVIVLESERLTALINDVIDLAEIESGKVEWNMQPISVPEMVTESLKATAWLFEKKPLTLVVDVEPGLPIIVGDPGRLIQVIVNLISNAVKFTEEGSVTCRALRVGDEIIVSIIDTGIGIDPRDYHKVFDSFVQVGDKLTDKPKGTGLGLPISKHVVERHGGRFWIESAGKPGQGTCFSFSLPIPITQPGG